MIKVRPHTDNECIWNNGLWTVEGECIHCSSCCKYRNLVCMYLNDEGKCSIYDSRPNVCKEFPYNMMPKQLYLILKNRKSISLNEFYKDCPIKIKLNE
jgi:hypothetical protein